jgi:hypothetical protein
MAAVAELEAGMISARTKAALAAAKKARHEAWRQSGRQVDRQGPGGGPCGPTGPCARTSRRFSRDCQRATGGRLRVTAGHCGRIGRPRHPHCPRRQLVRCTGLAFARTASSRATLPKADLRRRLSRAGEMPLSIFAMMDSVIGAASERCW